MPYIKPKKKPFAKMGRLLRGYGLNGTSLAGILGVSAPTAKKLLDNPEKLTLEALDKISRLAHIPMEELREAIIR